LIVYMILCCSVLQMSAKADIVTCQICNPNLQKRSYRRHLTIQHPRVNDSDGQKNIFESAKVSEYDPERPSLSAQDVNYILDDDSVSESSAGQQTSTSSLTQAAYAV
jgi:hypothetical protein